MKTSSIISLLYVHTVTDNLETLHKWERSINGFSPPFSCKQQSWIFYFTFKRKEIYKPISIWYFYESNNSSCVHVSYDHNSTYEHRISSTSWTLLDMMVQGYSALSLMSKSFPGNKSPNTYLSVHSNATTLGKYTLHTSTSAICLSSKILPLIQNREPIRYI